MPKKSEKPVVEPVKWSSSRLNQLFWGGLLVVVGGLFLLGNFEVIDVDTQGLLRLWPLLIILIGASVLASSSTVWRFVAMAVMGLSLLLVILVGSGVWGVVVDPTEVRNSQVERASSIEAGRVAVETGAGRVTIDSRDMDAIVMAQISGDDGYLSQESEIDGRTQEVTIKSTLPRNLSTITRSIDLSATLTESLPLSLDMSIGAAQLEADLRQVELESLELRAGASDIDIQFGSQSSLTEVDVRVGVSNVRLTVPVSSGVKVTTESGLSNLTLDGFNSDGDNVYITDNYADADNKIELTLRGGLANFTVERSE